MPLPLAFPTNPAAAKKLYSITEDEDDDDVLAILRNKNTSKTRQSSKSSNGITPTSSSLHSPSSISDNTHAELSKLSQSISRILEAQQTQQTSILEIQTKQQFDTKSAEERHDDILQRTSSSHEELSALRRDVEQLQSSIASEDVSSMSRNAAKAQQDIAEICNSLRDMAEELKSSNAQHREAFLSLKLSAESERKSLHDQITHERMASADQRAAFEKQIEIICKEKDEFEAEKQGIVMEEERLGRERKRIEHSEALLEQRKIAAREELENADSVATMIREAEAKIKDEMERLAQLSEFVRQKDAEAQGKLEHAEKLSRSLQEMDSSIKHDFENAEKQRQEIAENRMSLARERVSLLKERSRERSRDGDNHHLSKDGTLLQGTAFIGGLGLLQPSLRRAIASIKYDMNS